MDIGNAKLAFGLSIKLFDDILKGLHSKNVIPQQIEVEKEITIADQLKATIFLTADIDPPGFSLDFDASNQPQTYLSLAGRVTPRISFAGEMSPDLFTIDFSAVIRLDIKLKQNPGQAPVIALEFGGIKYVSDPFEAGFVESLINQEKMKNFLDAFKLDVLQPILETIGDIYYFDKAAHERPAIDQYPVILRLLPHYTFTSSAIVLFIGTPGIPLNTQSIQISMVPRFAQFMLHVGPDLVEMIKQKGKDLIEEFIKSFKTVELNPYELKVENNRVEMNARITETATGSYLNVDGYFSFRHVPGMKMMFMDGSDINVDVELPWWLDIIVAFYPPAEEKIRYAEQEVPDMMQKTATDMITKFMKNIDESMQIEGLQVGDLPIEVYPQEIKLDDNCLTAFVQILTWPIEEDIVLASYSKILGKFAFFELESGRKFYVDDLAKFMHSGLIRIPGYHQVGHKYIRSNPDAEETNNLEYRFGR